jgi:hypothetical protein
MAERAELVFLAFAISFAQFAAALVNQGKWTADAKQSVRYASARHAEAKELLAKWPTERARKHGALTSSAKLVFRAKIEVTCGIRF